MKVKFSTADEFLAELSKECNIASGPYAIDDQILRLTYNYRQDSHVLLRYLSVVAGVVIRGKIVELHQYIGEIMGDPALHEVSRNVKGRAEQIRVAVEAKSRELQLEVRAGMFGTLTLIPLAVLRGFLMRMKASIMGSATWPQ
jgi:hypothetical protein